INIQTISIAIVAWLVMGVSVLLVLFITQNIDKAIRACLLLVVPLGNTSFLGIPLIKSILGDESLSYILIYDQFGTFLAVSTFGAFIIGMYEHGKVNWQAIGKKIVTFPPFIAIVLAFIIGQPQEDVKPYLAILAATLTPLAMVSVGYGLRLSFGEDKAIFFKAMSLKLLIIPIIGFFIAKAVGLDGLALQTATLEAGMPSMITAGILAIRHNFAPVLASSMVGYGVLLSLFSVPLLNYILF
ncbi:MAG: hypothetical protein RL154_1571, partial [Pseudomonadota bacterium]